MSYIDRDAYNRSRVDWDKLYKYAMQVASETRAAPTSHDVAPSIGQKRETKKAILGWLRRSSAPVVAEPSTAGGHYWILESRHYVKKEKGRGDAPDETTRNIIKYCLDGDGSLFVWKKTVEEVFSKKGGCFGDPGKPVIRPMAESDVIIFDFAPKRYYQEGNGITVDSNIHIDESKLLQRVKGGGISVALKQLIEPQT